MAGKGVINNLFVNYLEINLPLPLSLQSETKVNVNHFLLIYSWYSVRHK